MKLDARQIYAGYGGGDVLRDVSMHAAAGELVGLVGPNGSGKSTLLRVLSRALQPRCGEVLSDGRPLRLRSAREIALSIGFVPQTEPALFDFTVRDVVMMGRFAHLGFIGAETSADYEAAAQAMADADVAAFAHRPITALSGGEHRRVLIARALAQCAPILLLDEPTAHLDLSHQSSLMSILRRLCLEKGCAVVAALHDLNIASEYCDRILLLNAGKLVAEGTAKEVLSHEVLGRVYGPGLDVHPHPLSGQPIVLPARLRQ